MKNVVEEGILEFDGVGDEKWHNGQLFNGIAISRYTNGKLRSATPHRNGFPEGICREWHPNGRLKSEYCSKHGQITSTAKEWHPNGTLKTIEEYEFGVCISSKEWDTIGNCTKDFKLAPDSAMHKYVLQMRSSRASR